MGKYQTYLIFGAPGSGKGTQGRAIGTIPGYYHFACGDVFRSLDLRTPLGQKFLEYSSRGELVPDEITVQLWKIRIDLLVEAHTFDPQCHCLILDGIPRNVAQAIMLEDTIRVRRVIHLSCPDRSKLAHRLKKRALRDNRFDDANESVITHRLETYDKESLPVLTHYGSNLVTRFDATQPAIVVLSQITALLVEDRAALSLEDGFTVQK